MTDISDVALLIFLRCEQVMDGDKSREPRECVPTPPSCENKSQEKDDSLRWVAVQIYCLLRSPPLLNLVSGCITKRFITLLLGYHFLFRYNLRCLVSVIKTIAWIRSRDFRRNLETLPFIFGWRGFPSQSGRLFPFPPKRFVINLCGFPLGVFLAHNFYWPRR